MSGVSKKTLTREEELLLQDFSRNVSTKSSALFYTIGFLVSVVPLWLYWRIWEVDLYSHAIAFVLGTFVNTWLLAFAYKNVKFLLKHQIAQKREDAVAKEILASVSSSNSTTVMSKKEKDERILWKKNVVSDYEATTYSIFYNNAIFYAGVVLFSFFLFKSFNPSFNYLLSVVGTGGLLALVSTSSGGGSGGSGANK